LKKCSPLIPLKAGVDAAGISPLLRGDSTQFFTQLLLVLDVYARYVERIPKAAVQANQDSLAILQDMREEIGMIAKTIETRDVNITNHAAKTDELCKNHSGQVQRDDCQRGIDSEKSRFTSGHQSNCAGNRKCD